jgi:hypothetical protein
MTVLGSRGRRRVGRRVVLQHELIGIVAPGVNILSTVPRQKRSGGPDRLRWLDGASMATPVAGVAAILPEGRKRRLPRS